MRTVRREKSFEDQATSILGTVEDADAAIQGIEWVLARETDFSSYRSFGDGRLRAYKTEPLESQPVSLVVYFTVDADKICLRAIAASEQPNDDA